MATSFALSVTAVGAVAALLFGSAASAAPAPAEVARSLAPHGRLRVAINYGNQVLAQRDPSGKLGGVSVALAEELGKRLGVPVELTGYDAAGKVFEALDRQAWDVAFLAIEPERATRIDFSPPYVFIDGTYLVRTDSPIRTAEDADRAGVRIAVGQGAAYDLFLTRTLKQGELVRAPTSADAIALFKSGNLGAAAGVRQALVDAEGPGFRVLADSFTRIEQAMAVPKGREPGAAYVRQFIEEMKASGLVRRALDQTGQTGATVAPVSR